MVIILFFASRGGNLGFYFNLKKAIAFLKFDKMAIANRII